MCPQETWLICRRICFVSNSSVRQVSFASVITGVRTNSAGLSRDNWQYLDAVRTHMPQNCSSDVQAALAYMDDVFASGNRTEMKRIQSLFGLESLTHFVDFATGCTYSAFIRVIGYWLIMNGEVRINLEYYQDVQPSDGPDGTGSVFYDFCDALEVVNGTVASAEGWGRENAINAWGKFWTDGFYDLCELSSSPPMFHYLTPNKSLWQCNSSVRVAASESRDIYPSK